MGPWLVKSALWPRSVDVLTVLNLCRSWLHEQRPFYFIVVVVVVVVGSEDSELTCTWPNHGSQKIWIQHVPWEATCKGGLVLVASVNESTWPKIDLALTQTENQAHYFLFLFLLLKFSPVLNRIQTQAQMKVHHMSNGKHLPFSDVVQRIERGWRKPFWGSSTKEATWMKSRQRFWYQRQYWVTSALAMVRS